MSDGPAFLYRERSSTNPNIERKGDLVANGPYEWAGEQHSSRVVLGTASLTTGWPHVHALAARSRLTSCLDCCHGAPRAGYMCATAWCQLAWACSVMATVQ
jgi:hypothetical protein